MKTNFKKCMNRLFNQKVLLCDLDGTLIETISGEVFSVSPYDWKFKPGIREAIQVYNPRYIFVISNQGGIDKGFVEEEDFLVKFTTIIKEIKTWGDFIVDGTYCTSNDPNNRFRKPNTGMVDFFREDFINGYDFDKRDALMIGDASGLEGQFSSSDYWTAKRAGIKYCDVNHFIEAMCPCKVCKDNNLPCGAGEDVPATKPCDGSKKDRLKKCLMQ